MVKSRDAEQESEGPTTKRRPDSIACSATNTTLQCFKAPPPQTSPDRWLRRRTVQTTRRPEDLATGKGGKKKSVLPSKRSSGVEPYAQTHTRTSALALIISGESAAVWLQVKNEGRQEDGEGEEERRHEGGGEN